MEQSALVKELVNELFTVMETIFKEMQVCWETVREDQANCLGCVFFPSSGSQLVQAASIIPLDNASKNSGSVYQVDVGRFL